jgi:serine/threonine protein phosphatase PrpC
MSPPRFKIAACTAQHIGDRPEQQDSVGIFTSKRRPGCALFVVADGMGGRTGGALAAQQVMTTAQSLFDDFSGTDSGEALLTQIVHEAHTIIRLSALSSEKEPHSTMVAMLLYQERAEWVHVGDSRLYHFQHSNLVERTIDHSFVEQLVKSGKLDPRKAQSHPKSNLLTNALGTEKMPHLSFGVMEMPEPGHNFLICTDGLWHYFNDTELGILINSADPRVASENIMQITRKRAMGGGDNCSMVIVKLEELPTLPHATAPIFPSLSKAS